MAQMHRLPQGRSHPNDYGNALTLRMHSDRLWAVPALETRKQRKQAAHSQWPKGLVQIDLEPHRLSRQMRELVKVIG